MSGKSNTYENNLLKLYFQNTNHANVGDATGVRGSTVAGSLYFGLFKTYPGEAADQTTNEADYGGYTRVGVARSVGGFTVTNNSVSPAANVSFPACTSGSNTCFYWGVGVASSGAGELLYLGGLGPSPEPFSGTASDDTIHCPAITFLVDDRVTFFVAEGALLPTGVTEGTVYFVKTVSSTDITISTTSGGATLDLTANGSGFAQKITPFVITSAPSVTPVISASSQILES